MEASVLGRPNTLSPQTSAVEIEGALGVTPVGVQSGPTHVDDLTWGGLETVPVKENKRSNGRSRIGERGFLSPTRKTGVPHPVPGGALSGPDPQPVFF